MPSRPRPHPHRVRSLSPSQRADLERVAQVLNDLEEADRRSCGLDPRPDADPTRWRVL